MEILSGREKSTQEVGSETQTLLLMQTRDGWNRQTEQKNSVGTEGKQNRKNIRNSAETERRKFGFRDIGSKNVLKEAGQQIIW